MSAPTMTRGPVPAPGFTDPTLESQRVFRAVLEALAHPTAAFPLNGPATAPAGLGPGLGAVALTVLDDETTAWLGGALREDQTVVSWLAFHTGVRRVEEAPDAAFVFATPATLPDLEVLTPGTDEEPHRSATVVLDVRGTGGSLRFRATGPGINGYAEFDAPWADDAFAAAWARNGRLFPRGVDLLLVGEASVSALPRTTHLTPLESMKEA